MLPQKKVLLDLVMSGIALTITGQRGVIWHKVIICDIGAMDYSKRRFYISILSCNRDSTL